MIKNPEMLLSITCVMLMAACSTSKNSSDCIRLSESTLGQHPSSGFLALQSNNALMILNMQTGESIKLSNEGQIDDFATVSPDGKLLAYKMTSLTSSDPKNVLNQLVIMSVDGHINKQLPWEQNWETLGYWLDNQQLIVKLYRNPPSTLSSLFLVDILSGKTTALNPDFPQIEDLTRLDWANSGKTIYAPTLIRVIYPSLENDGHKYILWDIREGKVLAKVPTRDFSLDAPRWSLDGSEVFVVGSGDNFSINNDEFFNISRDGNVSQITSFRSEHQSVDIRKWSLSPDGRYISFWYRVDDAKNYTLGILNVLTKKTKSYCIETQMDIDLQEPIWSTDGNQVVVGSDVQETGRIQEDRILLVNLVKNYRIKIGEDINPIGWMNSEQK